MKKVVILGGGVAGMSAAQELMERGFAVEVYEANPTYCGGKARSVDVRFKQHYPDSVPLPGEHGFRFFPGFYKHITDTMKKIPYTSPEGIKNENGVYDNLVATEYVMMARMGKPPIVGPISFPRNLDELKLFLKDIFGGVDSGLSQEEITFFAEKVWQLMTSCKERRENLYEKIGWWQFMEADRFSETYRHLLVEGLTRTLVAAQAKRASTKTGGDIFLQLIFNMLDPFVNTDRVLNGPTNIKWLTPWLEFLTKGGVKYYFDHKVIKLDVADYKISCAWVQDKYGNQIKLEADYYLLAVPIEIVKDLITREMIEVDSTFTQLIELADNVQWMNGLQFYLNEDVKINKGHVIYSDSQWAITSISQMQFWPDFDIAACYNKKVRGVLSVDISDWQSPGNNGKIAKDCTVEEIKDEVWLQLKQGLNINGNEILRDDMLEQFYLDHDIQVKHGKDERATNREPLLVNNVNTWCLRPPAYTNIANLFLSGDYVRTFTDLATMEGANESARRAVNCIIDASGIDAPFCEIWDLHEPGILAGFRYKDNQRWKKGLPWDSPVTKNNIFIVLFYKIQRWFLKLRSRKK